MPNSEIIAALIGAIFAFAVSAIAFRREDRHRFTNDKRALYGAYLKALRENGLASGTFAPKDNYIEAVAAANLVAQLSAEAGLLAGPRVLKAVTACRAEAMMLFANHMALVGDGPSPRVADMHDVQNHYADATDEFEKAAREELGVDRPRWKVF